MADNEALKHDNAELQNILAEAREDLRALQEEIDEKRAQEGPAMKHRRASSTASSGYYELSPTSPSFRLSAAGGGLRRSSSSKTAPSLDRRSLSMERPHRVFVRLLV